ncbi:MAG: hypothetical protein AAF085_17550 [Planctomycetota bacterium]
MSPRRPEPGAAERQQLERQQNHWQSEELARIQVPEETPVELLAWAEYAVQAVHHDYLECKLFDDNGVYGTSVNIAKSPAVRKSPYHGRTLDSLTYDYTDVQARTVTKAGGPFGGVGTSKDQIIIPKYLVAADETSTPAGMNAFIGSIITAAPVLTLVEDDAGDPFYCQLVERTQRAYANVEEEI